MSEPAVRDLRNWTASPGSSPRERTSNGEIFGSLRTLARQLHLWFGLTVGIHLLIMGLSGSALVFREEWNAALEPAIQKHEAVLPEQVAAKGSETLERDLPGFRPRMLVFSDGQRPVRMIVQKAGAPAFHVFLDPLTGKVLGRGPEVSLPDRVADFHHNLLIGRTGRVINGILAIVLLLLIATGLLLWATQPRPISRRLTVRWSNQRRGIFDLHTAVGFWLSPFLALIAFSAVYFAWHDAVGAFLNAVTFSKPGPAPPKVVARDGRATLVSIAAAAKQAMPEGKLSYIRMPEKVGEPVVVRVKHTDEWRSNGSSHVYLHPSDASVLLVDRTAIQPLGTRIVRNLAPLHFGEVGGRLTQVIWVLLGLTPGTLFLTGLFIWRRKVL